MDKLLTDGLTNDMPMDFVDPQIAIDEKTEKLKTKCLLAIQNCKSGMEQLQNDRKAALSAYMRNKYGNEIKGRSQVVMSDVADTIEWIMPSLMRIFYGSQDVVTLSPQGREDELKATLMEEKINFDFQKGMNGFQILYDFFKDALMYKMGVVKWRWDKTTKINKRFFETMTEMDFQAISMNPDYTITQTNPSMTVPGTFNIAVDERIVTEKPMLENVPPEEFVFNPLDRSVRTASFIAHKKRVKIAELRKYGVTDTDVSAEIDAFGSDPLYLERFEDLGGLAFLTPNETDDEVWLYECYINDYTDNGEAIPKKLTVIGNKVISIEDNTYGRPPFCVCSPIRMPHRMVGLGIAELVLEIQQLHTALARYILDNIYFQNNGVKVVNPMRINMDDLMNNNVPGGNIRTLLDTSPADAIFPVPIAPMPPHTLQILEYIDTVKENRTGITKYNQGLDSKSLNRTATGISQIMSAAQQRIELIGRIFAESEDGVKGMFQALVDLNLKFFSRSQSVKLNDQWTQISPADISGNYDLIIDIGAGTGSKEIKVNQLMMMLDKYMAIVPQAPNLVTPKNAYNVISAIWENMGFKNTDQFVSDPTKSQGGVNAEGVVGGPGGSGGGGQPNIPIGVGPGIPQGNGVLPMGGVQGVPGR